MLGHRANTFTARDCVYTGHFLSQTLIGTTATALQPAVASKPYSKRSRVLGIEKHVLKM